MKLGERLIRMIGGELLTRLSESRTAFLTWPGRRQRIEHLGYSQLRQYYEQKPFVQRACELSTDFLFAGGFKFKTEDEDLAAALAKFFAEHDEELDQAGIDGALYGNVGLVLWWDEEQERLRLRTESAEGIKRIPRLLAPWETEGYRIRIELEEGAYEQTLTRKESVVKTGRTTTRQPNPYGLIPLVMIRERRRSEDENGVGVVTSPVAEVCDEYGELRASASEGESYHGSPVPWVRGIKDSSAFGELMEAGDWGPKQMLELTEKGEAGFLETKRGCEGAREQLKALFHSLIVETGIPEYVWGVHMESAQASTKEQRDAVQRHAARRRRFWSPRLIELARVAGVMMEYHGVLKGDGRPGTGDGADIAIEWGQVVEADKLADAQADQARVTAVEAAVQSELLSRKTGIAKTELVEDPEAERKLIEAEKAERLKDEGGGMNPGQETQGTPGTEETGAEG